MASLFGDLLCLCDSIYACDDIDREISASVVAVGLLKGQLSNLVKLSSENICEPICEIASVALALGLSMQNYGLLLAFVRPLEWSILLCVPFAVLCCAVLFVCVFTWPHLLTHLL